MDNNPSPLDTLRQLKEWLDAGTITPQEFETLKRKLLFDEKNATAPEAHLIPPPVDDPLLPPVVVDEPGQPQLEPVILDPVSHRPTEAALPHSSPAPADELSEEAYEPERPAKQPLATVLIVAGVLLLLAVAAYLLLGNRESERLTSDTLTAADSTAVTVEEGPQAEQLELPPVAAPETIRVQPAIPLPAPDTTPAATAPGPEAPIPAAAESSATSEAAIRSRVQRTLTALYADMEAAPFNASQHFAPQVERFYLLQNTTPAAIEDELNRSHFPEFLESQLSYEPGSLQISPVAEDGTVMVQYQERGRSLRKSRNQYQQTLAQVRARLDRNGKLTYFRQERLLENNFTDAAKPAPAAPAATE
ncbi:hypothetical protein [Hymenobacter sp. B81]|uniref:hypothetical protein n=1 Tax=Hymenobacter sp. B81 TaxID=3344878 RepID=UPI0037DD41EC